MLTRILIVEDDEIQRGALTHMLAQQGHFVETAHDGLDALRKVRAGAFDVVLMDYRMPQIDGIAAARLITDLTDRARRPRLIGISATPEALPACTGTSSGLFEAVVAKPCGAGKLLEALRGGSADLPDRAAAVEADAQPAAHYGRPVQPPAEQTLPDAIRVLVVDDDAIMRELAGAALKADGCHVQTCADGFEALQILARVPIDVVVLDLMMPDIDGVSTARLAFEFLDRTHRPRLIALTSAPDQLAARETDSVSLFDAVLSKSNALSAMIQAVRQSADYRRRRPRHPLIGLEELTRLTALFRPQPAALPVRAGTPILDCTTFDQVAACLPRATLASSLRALAVRAQDLLENVRAQARDDQALVQAVHALAGSAGLLGFQHLSDACLSYERATICNPEAIDGALAALEPAIERALEELSRLSAQFADA